MPTHPLSAAAGLAACLLLAGCTAPTAPLDADGGGTGMPERLVLAFSVKDDYQAFVAKADPLGDWVEQHTGIPTTILPVADESASIAALANGQAHAAFMDGGAAWIGWTTFGIEAIVADVHSDGRAGYTAVAWVKADSGIRSPADLEGKRSCHTSDLGSSGMLAPMGYLIGQGLIDLEGLDRDDIASLQAARERFFQASHIGGGYAGAMQCMSSGQGDVAFAKDSTWDDQCGKAEAPAWCLPRDAYTTLPATGFADVPSHPVMVAKDLSPEARDALRAALLALNDSPEGHELLTSVLNTAALVEVDTEAHLGSFGDVLRHVPGIRAYLEGKKVAS